MSKVITVDLDGVVVGGNYLPEWDRTCGVYATLPEIPGASEGLRYLKSQGYKIYYLSARRFPDSLNTTHQWLLDHGCPTGEGIILGVNLSDKMFISRALGSIAHIDDCPRALIDIYKIVKPILFVGREEQGWWDGTQEAMEKYTWTNDWKTLVNYIETLT